ncbi:expressed unknown protein [Seminavis robusta]|uniref:Uncharacterized protein n=1 Tax=Seminavis robusta TaxID=568900 RepID=A0A9N8DD42_9STRA|nr:expressed unknown protein [Seminavis robusta]|eukprot:Sro20_g014270.1 n/a (509) ;mRNA; r:127664-129190
MVLGFLLRRSSRAADDAIINDSHVVATPARSKSERGFHHQESTVRTHVTFLEEIAERSGRTGDCQSPRSVAVLQLEEPLKEKLNISAMAKERRKEPKSPSPTTPTAVHGTRKQQQQDDRKEKSSHQPVNRKKHSSSTKRRPSTKKGPRKSVLRQDPSLVDMNKFWANTSEEAARQANERREAQRQYLRWQQYYSIQTYQQQRRLQRQKKQQQFNKDTPVVPAAGITMKNRTSYTRKTLPKLELIQPSPSMDDSSVDSEEMEDWLLPVTPLPCHSITWRSPEAKPHGNSLTFADNVLAGTVTTKSETLTTTAIVLKENTLKEADSTINDQEKNQESHHPGHQLTTEAVQKLPAKEAAAPTISPTKVENVRSALSTVQKFYNKRGSPVPATVETPQPSTALVPYVSKKNQDNAQDDDHASLSSSSSSSSLSDLESVAIEEDTEVPTKMFTKQIVNAQASVSPRRSVFFEAAPLLGMYSRGRQQEEHRSVPNIHVVTKHNGAGERKVIVEV